ncbi:MAG: hypothetical protein CMJ83_02740 [Planctomycetes bacterium]|nr:hypothetical protein [Planctomycetota bacterium]
MTRATVLIVGCGDIGWRHVQAAAGVPSIGRIVVVEPRQTRRNDILGLAGELSEVEVDVVSGLDDAESAINGNGIGCAIAAVTADRQPEVVEGIAAMAPRAVLVEKPAAQSPEALESIIATYSGAISEKRIYVNCVRNLFEGWRRLRDGLAERPGPFHMLVTGEGWGYGCNSVHLVEAFRFAAGAESIACTAAIIEAAPEFSRRGPEFEEFVGSATFRVPHGDTLTLVCGGDGFGPGPIRITVRDKESGAPVFVLEENEGTLHDLVHDVEHPIGSLPVSESTGVFLQKLLADASDCGLPRLREAAPSHRAVYDSLAKGTGRSQFMIT